MFTALITSVLVVQTAKAISKDMVYTKVERNRVRRKEENERKAKKMIRTYLDLAFGNVGSACLF